MTATTTDQPKTIVIRDTPTDQLREMLEALKWQPQGSKLAARRVRILRGAIELTLRERGETP